jgi:hypothetical protein
MAQAAFDLNDPDLMPLAGTCEACPSGRGIRPI